MTKILIVVGVLVFDAICGYKAIAKNGSMWSLGRKVYRKNEPFFFWIILIPLLILGNFIAYGAFKYM